MAFTAKDVAEFEKIAATAAKRRQPVPDYVVFRPALRYDLVFWYTAYCELQRVDFAFSECLAYAEHYGVSFELLRHIMTTMWSKRNDHPRRNRT